MQALIIFDVNDNNTEKVKAALKNKGYYTVWITTDIKITYYLPNNTVWKPNIELSMALKDINNVIEDLKKSGNNIILQRCIVVSASPWDGVPGVPI